MNSFEILIFLQKDDLRCDLSSTQVLKLDKEIPSKQMGQNHYTYSLILKENDPKPHPVIVCGNSRWTFAFSTGLPNPPYPQAAISATKCFW